MSEELTIQDCTLCGRCKLSCPTYRILNSEQNSPRGWAELKKNNILHEIFYRCTLCNACKEACPGNIDLGFLETRTELEGADITTEKFKIMAMNMLDHGTPYGKQKKGEQPKNFFSF